MFFRHFVSPTGDPQCQLGPIFKLFFKVLKQSLCFKVEFAIFKLYFKFALKLRARNFTAVLTYGRVEEKAIFNAFLKHRDKASTSFFSPWL